MNRRAPFRQADVSRAVKGATAGGLRVARVEIDASGTIVLITEGRPEATPAPDENDPAIALAKWKAERDARAAARNK